MRIPLKSALAAFALILFARAVAAQPKGREPNPMPQVAPTLDKVLMESFVNEPSPIPPGTAQITLRVTVKNVTNTGGAAGFVLNGLKLKIFRTNPQPDVLELETTVNNLGPGATQSFGAHVNIAPGVREYFARVDMDDTLHEPIIQRANNERRLKLTIPLVSRDQAAAPGSAPAKETQLLDYDKAKRSGAQFSISMEGRSLCGPSQTDVNDAWLSGRSGKPAAGVWFALSCTSVPTGGRTAADAFMNFHLKNGWKVKGYDVVGIHKEGGNADWQWNKTPSVNTDDPSGKIHMWADLNGSIELFVKVEIEGPAGTNPYQ